MGMLSGMSVGFVGLGPAGKKLADKILAAGATTYIFSRSPSRRYEMIRTGFSLCQTPAEVAANVAGGIIIVLIDDEDGIDAIADGPENLLDALTAGSLVIDMANTSDADTDRFAALALTKGANWIETETNENARGADIKVCAKNSDFTRVLPILNCLSDHITHVGEIEHRHGDVTATVH